MGVIELTMDDGTKMILKKNEDGCLVIEDFNQDGKFTQKRTIEPDHLYMTFF